MDWLMRLADRAFGAPAPETVERYLGARDACYLAYATDGAIRAGAASGGTVSALLIHLLERGVVRGALVSRATVVDGAIEAHPTVARTREAILQAQSSIYMEFPWLAEALPLLEQTPGPLAVVGLPCMLEALETRAQRDPELARRIGPKIGLVCGRSSSKDLLLRVLAQKGVREEDVAEIRFREGHWRGQMRVGLRDGSQISFPFQHFSLYRNLHFHCQGRCLQCEDPLAEHADLVCGDVWLSELKDAPIKHSLVISRDPRATEWLQEMVARDELALQSIPPETVFRAQRRGLIPAKRGKPAKARLAKLFGYRIEYDGPWRSRWNDYLVAAMVLLNHRWGRSPRWRRWIFRLPRPLLKLYLVAMSFLKNF